MKFKITVTKVFSKDYYVNADDKDHALEIASEAVDEFECNWNTEVENHWDANPVDSFKENDIEVYEPIQNYLK